MSLGEFFKDWGGHILSVLSIIGGGFLFLRYDRRIKEQERKLNDYQLKKYQDEDDLKRQAYIKCNLVNIDGGHLKIRFFNSGQAEARNVKIEIINKDSLDGVVFTQDWGPYDSITHQIGYREEDLFLCEGSAETIQICMTWDDDFRNNQSSTQTLQL